MRNLNVNELLNHIDTI